MTVIFLFLFVIMLGVVTLIWFIGQLDESKYNGNTWRRIIGAIAVILIAIFAIIKVILE